MSLDLQWPQYPQPLRLDRATLPAAPDFLLHRRGKRAGAALADLKSYEDAAPFFMTREWRHGVPRKTWEGYLAVAGRCRVPFALIVAELARGRIGILRDTPEGLIEGTGKGASWVYWRQSAFSWIDGFDVPNDFERIPRPYNSAIDEPTKEVFERAVSKLGRNFDQSLELGHKAELAVARFLERKGFTLWRLVGASKAGRQG